MQLGDTDDPQSAWTFGDAAELFQYRFAGSHTVVRTSPTFLGLSIVAPGVSVSFGG
jgi:hypothetical protein